MTARSKAIIKPEILVWARSSAGLSLPEAAHKLQIEESKLIAWESGGDAPSIPQLRKIANAYKRPLAVFYLQEIPTDFQVMRDLRRLPGTGHRYTPPELIFEVRKAYQRRALAMELFEDIDERVQKFELTAKLTDDPEFVGQRIREFLNITEHDQRRYRESRIAFNDWRAKLESRGVLVFQATSFGSEVASGFAIAEEQFPIVVVNSKDQPARRSFSLMHELAHLMLRVSGISDLDSDDSRPPEDQAIEVFCNQVAAAALMPKDWLLSEELVSRHGMRSTRWSDEEISGLARIFSVSREALLRRLLTFGRTTEKFYREKRAQYNAEYAALKQRQREQAADDGIPRNMPRETMSNLGMPLVKMVLNSYYLTKLTLSDVAGYLGIKTKHIPNLEFAAGFK